MSTSLEATLAEKAKVGLSASSRLVDGSLAHAPLELLDDNPWQPRSHIDEKELLELVDSIRAQGLIQPIAVRPKQDGRFTIVAGHRRVAAYRRLLETEPEGIQKKYAAIAATVKAALNDAQLAAQAYAENVARASLTPLDEAMALEKMLEKGLAQTPEQLAELVQQSLPRVKRLRRLAVAPRCVKAALSPGVLVVAGQDADGKEKREQRRLDLIAAIAFTRLFEHLRKTQPKKAEERTEAAVRRALAGGWGARRVDEYVDGVIRGRSPVDADEGDDVADVVPVFSETSRRFVIEREKLKGASAEQRAAFVAALRPVLAEAGFQLQSDESQR